MQNVNYESESDGTSTRSEARHIAGREGATCAVTGRTAREFSFLSLKIKPCRAKNRYPYKTSTTRARKTAPARAARRGTLPAKRARPARSRGGELERLPFLNLKVEPRRAKMQNANHESESDGTGPCSEAWHIAGREGATCAVTGRRARAFSISKSESRTSPREESLPMQHANHETARGSRSEEWHITGRESATCARRRNKKKKKAGARPAGSHAGRLTGAPAAANHKKIW